MVARHSGASNPSEVRRAHQALSLPIWNELLVGIEMVYLRLSPVYWLHHSVLRAAQLVRGQILERHAEGVLPACYTAACTCNFLESLMVRLPKSVMQTAIYTKSDGIVDWRVCRTGHPGVDYEVSATHIGLAFNPIVFDVVAHRLAGKSPGQRLRP